MTNATGERRPVFAPTISQEARVQMQAAAERGEPPLDSIQAARADAVRRTAPIAARRLAQYGATVREADLGGIPVQHIRPHGWDGDDDTGPVLLNFHGGGFVIDYAALPESVPIAALTGVPVASVMYRLAPEHTYPAAVDDALAAYIGAIETRSAARVGLFGTSAGAILTLQLLVRLKAEGVPMPASAGLFSVSADFARAGDCEAFLPPLTPGLDTPGLLAIYRGDADVRDPLISPLYGDLRGLPPILLMTSTRDQFLSQTVMLHEALIAADVPTELRVFEGMTHGFWTSIDVPESRTALAAQAAFLGRHLGTAASAPAAEAKG
ncbi:alpha/beta hydrolase [Sphingomonas sp. A2-49]|uniref:alpha/beta hydrolase n=1 Tax=Sphingomonas sp. A2-49 TaxID=1391375 RepID=UPI0021D3C83B|nr:alpha/beta hydrolase [Sphingomonas sp. A2-49]MCU6455547.1 alpha/beta hydrolase [Sphingomonas sp. A2-49]